jgi:hypothetical protein
MFFSSTSNSETIFIHSLRWNRSVFQMTEYQRRNVAPYIKFRHSTITVVDIVPHPWLTVVPIFERVERETICHTRLYVNKYNMDRLMYMMYRCSLRTCHDRFHRRYQPPTTSCNGVKTKISRCRFDMDRRGKVPLPLHHHRNNRMGKAHVEKLGLALYSVKPSSR